MTKLNITTFNIRCFGSSGDYFGKLGTEHRIPFLKSFIDTQFPHTDVFVFQEIMVPSLLEQILPKGFKTYTYEHEYSRHMYIVLACRKEFKIQNFQKIPETALDTKRSRPAVYGQLIVGSQTKLDIIGVHLKSKNDHTENRVKQCRSISRFIETLSPDLPKLLTGDFNTHLKEKTLKPENDLNYLQETFKDQLTLVDHKKTTYLAADEVMKLDHFFVSGLNCLDIEVYHLPYYSQEKSFRRYYDEISDHLPVSTKVQLP